ncbi:MAG: hypothetical protein FH756_01140 [Firmicutes bacterium]|nr:hypothetical protein [Bacillota bacterium]
MFEVFKLAPLDRRAKLTTVITLIGAGIFTLGFIYLFPFLFAPRKYLLSPRGIEIRSLIATDLIERNNISSLEILKPIKHGSGINTCTSDFFGYSGEYTLANGSVARVYATSWERMVKITACKGDAYLLSPLEPESFVQAVKQCYPNTGEKVESK